MTLTITYWGTTGTLTAPPRPGEITDKIVATIQTLIEKDELRDLKPGPTLAAQVRQRVHRHIPLHQRAGYGGNTTCIEVQTPDNLLILDCGSGFRDLGPILEARWKAQGNEAQRRAHVLITHPHMDHTYGTPYFVPYYNPMNYFTLWGSESVLGSLQAVFTPGAELSQVFFPPTFEHLKAIREQRVLVPNMDFMLGTTRVRTVALNHPGGCLGFRLDCDGRSFVFATDHEQTAIPDPLLLDFARGADLLYTEGQYTQAEYDGRVGICGDPPMSRHGWGHSTVEACVGTALAAEVRRLHIGHREPRRSDAGLAEVESYAKQLAQRADKELLVEIPYEGMTVAL